MGWDEQELAQGTASGAGRFLLLERDFLQGHVVIGQGTMVLNREKVGLDLTLGRNSAL